MCLGKPLETTMPTLSNKVARRTSLLLTAAVMLVAAGTAVGAANTVDFNNPATAMSSDAVVASGTCIAKYVRVFDDATKPAAEIAQRVAKRCAKEISKSAGLASFMVGRPDEYAKNLRYTQEELTTNAVLRARAAASRRGSV